jgi:transposase
MPQPNDLSRSLVALDQNSTIIAVVELSQSSWLVGGMLPGIERQPRKKLDPSPERLLALLRRWQDEAVRAGRTITRIALAFEAGRDGFWLARWLAARGRRRSTRSKRIDVFMRSSRLRDYLSHRNTSGLPKAS